MKRSALLVVSCTLVWLSVMIGLIGFLVAADTRKTIRQERPPPTTTLLFIEFPVFG